MELILILITVAAIPAASQVVRALITILSRLIAVGIVITLTFAFLLIISSHLHFR